MQSRYIVILSAALILLGLVMIPLPGPGFVIVSLGVVVALIGAVLTAANRGRGRP